MMDRSARAGLARLCAAAFVGYCSYSICRTPLLPLFARALGASPSMVGLVMAASTLTGVCLKMPAGALSDHLGRRRLLLAGALVFALMPFTYFAVASLAALIFLRVAHGSATAIFGPVASASVSDLAPASQRGAWLGTYATFQNAGQALGPVLAGYLIAVERFDLAFLTAGVIGVGAPLIVAGWTPPQASSGSLGWHAFTDGLLEVVRHRLILVTSAAHAAQFMLNGALNAFLPLYAREVVGLTPPQIGWLFAVHVLTTLIVRPIVGAASDRAGRRGVIATGLVVCSLAVLALSVTTSAWALVVAVLTYAAGVATTTAATSAFITDVTKRQRYGTAHGVFGTIYDIGDATGPIAAGLIVSAFGYAPLFRILAGVGIAMAIVFAMASRETR
jgi:MFS family permease